MRDYYNFRVLVICGAYTILGFTVGSFLAHALQDIPNWTKALEDSVRSAIPIAVYIFFVKSAGSKWL